MHNELVEDEPMEEVEITVINGKRCMVHTVEASDSLPRLSIMYNVTEGQIKLFNNMPNDMIHHKDKLNIPMAGNFRYVPKKKKTAEEALNEERARQDWVLSMMN